MNILVTLIIVLIAIVVIKTLLNTTLSLTKTAVTIALVVVGAWIAFKYVGGTETVGAAISTAKEAMNQTIKDAVSKLPLK